MQRLLLGLASAALTLAAITFAVGPARAQLVEHDDPLPFKPDRMGRVDTPIDEALAQRRPDIVVLGSSVVDVAFAEGAFQKIVKRRTLDLTVPGSMSAIWYLSIKNFICKAEHRPKMVVLGFRDAYLTVPEYRVDGSYKRLVDRYVVGIDPILDRRAYLPDASDAEVFLRRHWSPMQRREQVIASTENLFKEAAVGRVLGMEPDAVGDAVDRVFSKANRIPSNLTGFERRAAWLATATYFDFEYELPRSFLPDMIELCREHGIQLVLMRMKPRRNAEFPTDRSHFPEYISVDLAAYEAKLDAYLEDEGVTLIDFAEDPRIPFEWYASQDHLNVKEGRTGFTKILAEELKPLIDALPRD